MGITMRTVLLCIILFRSPLSAQESNTFGINEKIGGQIPMELTFVGEEGDIVTLKSLVQKPTILSLVYYKCPGICSPLLDGMVEVLDRVGLEPETDFSVLTISIDPSEGPELAKGKKRNYLHSMQRQFPSAGWRFLTGSRENIEALTSAVGFVYKKEGREFRHPASLILLCPDGTISRYMYGTTYLPLDLELAIRKANKGETSSTIAKVLQYCFTDDPKGRIQAYKVLSMGGAFITGMGLCLLTAMLIRRKNGNLPKES